MQGLAETATADSLGQGDIYVIANAIAESDQKGWKLPAEQAFTESEIEAIRLWVEEGGSLLLIADHMPFPGSVADLAAAFDILFGEAAMFSAQEWITKDERVLMGMNRPDAAQNPQFLLNVMHWLSGLLD